MAIFKVLVFDVCVLFLFQTGTKVCPGWNHFL